MHTLVEVKNENDPSLREQDNRKPYAKPQVIYRAPLEAVAASCGNPPFGKATLGTCTAVGATITS